MDLKELIKQLTHEILEEESASSDVSGYLSPNAFARKGQGKNAATKQAEEEGWKVTKGETTMPGDSKVRDYVSLTGKKKKKVKIYKESNYDQASKYGAESGYTKASGYTGVGRDNHASTYYKESMDKFDATSMAKEYLGIEKYNSIFNSGKLAAEKDETENPYARTHNTISRQAWDDGFNSIKKENMNENSNKTFEYSNKVFKIGDKVKHNGDEWIIDDITTTGDMTFFIMSTPGLDKRKFDAVRVASSNVNESLINIIKEELLNEVTYSKFKNEIKFRTKNEQLHRAIREVKRKLSEIDRIVEYTSLMKQELSENEAGSTYWKATQKNVTTIAEMVNTLNNKIKNLQQ